MSIVYPLTPPAFGIRRVRFTLDHVVGLTMGQFSRRQQTFDWQADQILANITLKPMVRADAEQWITFKEKLNGVEGTFLLGYPVAPWRGTAPDTGLVNGAGQSGRSLITDGWGAAKTLKAGDWFQVGTGEASRLHKILNDVMTDGAGNATLDIAPRLRESPADNAPLVIDNPVGTFRLVSNKNEWDLDEMQIYGITFDIQEAL